MKRLFQPVFFRMARKDFLSFALFSRFMAMCFMTAKLVGRDLF